MGSRLGTGLQKSAAVALSFCNPSPLPATAHARARSSIGEWYFGHGHSSQGSLSVPTLPVIGQEAHQIPGPTGHAPHVAYTCMLSTNPKHRCPGTQCHEHVVEAHLVLLDVEALPVFAEVEPSMGSACACMFLSDSLTLSPCLVWAESWFDWEIACCASPEVCCCFSLGDACVCSLDCICCGSARGC